MIMSISSEIERLNKELPSTVKLVAVSKFNPSEAIMEAYQAGQRVFGESRPQELLQKVQELPRDIQWHFIGHLQTNKLKMVLPYAALIHSVDSERLLMEINKYAVKNNLKVKCLLELFVAQEETKQGFSNEELMELMEKLQQEPLQGVEICGLMGMASFVEDEQQIRGEFAALKETFDQVREKYISTHPNFNELSMGMSGDYRIAVEMGSTMVRIGTTIFGARNYSK
ncbi:MAG: YggS family pyridoxal phosphate-dependent enzyme [Bacteroidales bacterium]|nr:YggS family pyridoxal phosphate-dependent enzyme [Bacteroidales bacterium]